MFPFQTTLAPTSPTTTLTGLLRAEGNLQQTTSSFSELMASRTLAGYKNPKANLELSLQQNLQKRQLSGSSRCSSAFHPFIRNFLILTKEAVRGGEEWRKGLGACLGGVLGKSPTEGPRVHGSDARRPAMEVACRKTASSSAPRPMCNSCGRGRWGRGWETQAVPAAN